MLSEWECKKRWRCPTDRELVLKAKVNKGWSIHTANAFLKPEVFEVDEIEAIEKVIRRANDLERSEVERVGRMVCKLENMTRNALGDGEKTCSMCGTTFGIFRSSFVKCVDCGKAVCEKCRVDTVTASLDICMLCKICSENREVWKKSGGWFYGKVPTITVTYEKKCESQISGSPSPVRAFDTWSHRAPDIVRFQSYEPPEENHNDHSHYTSWATNLDEAGTFEDSDQSEEDQNDHSRHKDSQSTISIPDIHYSENSESLNETYKSENICTINQSMNSEREEVLEEQHSVVIQHEDLIDSIPDLLITGNSSFAEIEPIRKHSIEQKLQKTNFLSVLSTSLPSSRHTDSQGPCKLRRKASIRRKRTSDPAHGNQQDQ